MYQRELIAYLREQGCEFLREGAKHSVFFNPVNNKVTTVPRHNQIEPPLARKICRDLEIPPINKK